MKKSVSLLAAAASVLVLGCEPGTTDNSNPEFTTIELAYMDETVDPSVDFFTYCNGTWCANNPVPSTESSWGSFNELQERNNKLLKEILEEAASSTQEKGSAQQLVGDYYHTFLDAASRDAAGLDPIAFLMDSVDAMTSAEDLPKVMALLHNYSVGAFFELGVEQDLKDNSRHVIYLGQGGLALPSKDYYLDDRHAGLRDEYRNHVKTMFGFLGHDATQAEAATENALKIESELAVYSRGPVELRNIQMRYNPMTMDSVRTIASTFDWDQYFSARDLPMQESMVITEPNFLARFNGLPSDYTVEEIKSYLKWKIIDDNAGALTSEIDDQNFAFYGTIMAGRNEKKEEWKRALSAITGSPIAEALGKAFVDKAFSPEDKAKVNEMVDNLMAAFEDRLDSLTWMSAETKDRAREKLVSFSRKLGYPDQWKSFDGLEIDRTSYGSNYLNARAFAVRENLDKIGKPIDKSEWGMPAHMVNAYYNPLYNEIVFPAGIMQPPFFDPSAEDAINYGRMGMVIGHEFTHGFDDQGSQFDKDGLLSMWWTSEDSTEFSARTQKLVDHFNEFEALDGVFVNGELTLGENIADLGGLTLSYYAYQKSLEGKDPEIVHGLTPEQRFFIGFGQLWKINYKDEALMRQIETNPHAPGKYRVLGPLQNMPEFWEAFSVEEGDPMRRPADKVAKIW